MSTLRIVGAVLILGGLLWLVKTVSDWHERSAELSQVQAEYSAFRIQTSKAIAAREQRQRISDEISASYVGVIRSQGAELADAHTRLAGVRVHVGACPRAVPAAPTDANAPAGAPAEGSDGQSGVVAATDVADRLAACDAVGARLNAIADWYNRQSLMP